VRIEFDLFEGVPLIFGDALLFVLMQYMLPDSMG